MKQTHKNKLPNLYDISLNTDIDTSINSKYLYYMISKIRREYESGIAPEKSKTHEELVTTCLPLVRRIFIKYFYEYTKENWADEFLEEEIVGAGLHGLVNGINSLVREDKKNNLGVLQITILQSMKRHLKKHLVRQFVQPRSDEYDVGHKNQDNDGQYHQSNFDNGDIARYPLDLDEFHFGDDECCNDGDNIDDKEACDFANELAGSSNVEYQLYIIKNKLTSLQFNVFCASYGLGTQKLTVTQLSEKLNVTTQNICSLRKRAVMILRWHYSHSKSNGLI